MKSELADNFFRHEFGKLLATLTRRVGSRHFHDVEDAVQAALHKAVETWAANGVPDNPSAWLFRVAQNSLFSELRKQANRGRIVDSLPEEDLTPRAIDNSGDFEEETQDDLLNMLFACCDEKIPINSQLVFALKALCGFSIQEVATRLFIKEENAYKRYSRARSRLQSVGTIATELSDSQYSDRLSSIHKVLYLLFTEGHLSSHPDIAIRKELCDEAIRLGNVLVRHPNAQTPTTYALLALFYFHSARLNSRQNSAGELLLLEEQDRTLWDKAKIKTGLSHLANSAFGESFTRYHAEAGIAAEHCLAPSFQQTRWKKIAELYQLLDQVSPSPLHLLNRAVAIAEFQGPEVALELLVDFNPPSWLSESYQWFAVLADLHRRSGEKEEAAKYRGLALDTAPTQAIKSLIKSRLAKTN